MSNNTINFKDVHMEYQVDNRVVTVFDKLNLEIKTDEITVITGRSGCGKTTLLRLVAGIEKPTSGEISIPKDIRIGMMFQEDRLMPWLRCDRNVALGMKNVSKKEVYDMLKLVGLEGFERAYPGQLSGGMRQRVALARTLIRKSNLILMDEPFASLDGYTRQDMQQELLRIKKDTGAGIIFVTHDLNEATILGDRIISL